MAKRKTGKTSGPKEESRSKKRDLNIEALSRVDRIGQYILLIGMVLCCLIIISVTDNFLGPIRINGLDAGGQVKDVFALGKWAVLLVTSLLLLALVIYKIIAYGYSIQKNPANLPAAILAILVALSCLFSEYPAVALMGVPDIHFGTLPLLALLLLFFMLLNTRMDSNLLRNLGIGLAIITIGNIIITAGYSLGVQWFQAPIIGSLIVPEGLDDSLVLTGNLQSTFNNPNYASGLFGSLAVFFVALAATINKKLPIAAFMGLGLISIAIAALSLSTSGFAVFCLMIPFLFALLLLNKENRAFRYSIVAASIVITLVAGWYAISNNPRVYTATAGWVEQFVEGMNSKTLDANTTEQTHAQDSTDKFVVSVPIDVGWDSSRLYLAKTSWDLATERPLLGYGMDTMVYYYPYLSREAIRNLGINSILTKPHNMYLQLALGAGIPALLAFLALAGIYLALSIKEVIKSYSENGDIPGLPTAILLFIMAFLIQGLVNDLTIGPAMCFFVMLGLGYQLLWSDQETKHSSRNDSY